MRRLKNRFSTAIIVVNPNRTSNDADFKIRGLKSKFLDAVDEKIKIFSVFILREGEWLTLLSLGC